MNAEIVYLHGAPKRSNSARVGWIVAENGCHIWQGCRSNRGYGTVFANGGARLVHRIRYEREIGPIPDGTVLDHFACDGGPLGCVNPQHCRPVTQRENSLRSESVAAIAAAKTHCPQGHPYDERNTLRSEIRLGNRVCRECRLAYRSRYREANKDKIAEQARAQRARRLGRRRELSKKRITIAQS